MASQHLVWALPQLLLLVSTPLRGATESKCGLVGELWPECGRFCRDRAWIKCTVWTVFAAWVSPGFFSKGHGQALHLPLNSYVGYFCVPRAGLYV